MEASSKRILFVALLVCSILPPCLTYVIPLLSSPSSPSTFGIRTSPFLPRVSKFRSPFLVAARRKSDDEEEEDDDDWEPDENDLVQGLSDFDLTTSGGDDDDDEDLDIISGDGVVSGDGVLAAATVGDDDDDDSRVVAKATDDDDDEDEDEIDEGLDIWEEDEDEDDEEGDDGEIVEEIEDEEELESSSTYLMPSGKGYNGAKWEEIDEDEVTEDIPLQDDPNDPNYQTQKRLLEETVARREQLKADEEFDEVDFVMNHMTPEQASVFDEIDIQQKVESMASQFNIEEIDLEGVDSEEAIEQVTDILDDPYVNEGEENIMGTEASDDLLEKFDQSLKSSREIVAEEPWDKVNLKARNTNWDSLPKETIDEMDACLDEIGGSSYNCTNWLLYDLDFNVSNLILAAVKHNREAPVIFQHWYPQLITYERYQHARDRNFDFNWNDVENADMEELERYYMGFGYDEIPLKAPAETGMISFEDLDEEEIKMAAFQNWMNEVYNPEWDRKDFDDDSFQDEDNVFSKFYEAPQHPDLPTFEDAQDDLREWEAQMDDDEDATQEYADMMGKDMKYEYVDDPEFEREFRGHLIVACTPMDEDIEIAEKLTKRMEEEFGKKVYVETRVIAHAREEDNVFEIWLESYEVDLLHSKRRAMANREDWDGPAECDDKQIEYLVEEVRFLISDDSRYSCRFDTEMQV
eukprot:scaffold822_cov130-Cylindrotheca_fusiformis.AAC.4